MTQLVEFYEVLGLSLDASAQEVRAAYLDLVKVWHPDRFANEPERLQRRAEEQFKRVNAAYRAIVERRKDGGAEVSSARHESGPRQTAQPPGSYQEYEAQRDGGPDYEYTEPPYAEGAAPGTHAEESRARSGWSPSPPPPPPPLPPRWAPRTSKEKPGRRAKIHPATGSPAIKKETANAAYATRLSYLIGSLGAILALSLVRTLFELVGVIVLVLLGVGLAKAFRP